MARAVLLPGKEERVYSGHPWIFKSDIMKTDGHYTPGDVVRVESAKHRFLCMAVFNPRSQIALRVLSYQDQKIGSDFIHERVRRAVEYRRAFADMQSCRMIFAESDGLPAVICDKFGDYISMQCLCLGMEQFKQDICDALEEELHPRGIWERNDVPVRELEGLEQMTGLLRGNVPDLIEMQ